MNNKKYSIITYNDIPFLVISDFVYDLLMGDHIEYQVKLTPFNEVPKSIWERIKAYFTPDLCKGVYFKDDWTFTLKDKDKHRTYAEAVRDNIAEALEEEAMRKLFEQEFINIGEELK